MGPAFTFGCPDPGILALSFLVVSLLVPLIEETINRGLILQSLMHRGRFFAVVLSSVLFAIMHDPQAIVVSFLAGLFLAVQMMEAMLADIQPTSTVVDTLAAAYAETGDYQRAIKTQTAAISLLEIEGSAEWLDDFNKRLGLYRDKKPWRD